MLLNSARSTANTSFGDDLLGQLLGKAERVVKLERRLARQHGPRFEVAQLLVEQLVPRAERPSELFFFARDHLDDRIPLREEFRIGLAHHVDGGVDQLRHDQIVGTEEESVAHRTTDQPAQHVARDLRWMEPPCLR